MASLYVDWEDGNAGGTAESAYFTALRGASTNAYSTITAATTAMSAGDTVHIRGGTYAERVNISFTKDPCNWTLDYGDVHIDNTADAVNADALIHPRQFNCRGKDWLIVSHSNSGTKYNCTLRSCNIDKLWVKAGVDGIRFYQNTAAPDTVRIGQFKSTVDGKPINHYGTGIQYNITIESAMADGGTSFEFSSTGASVVKIGQCVLGSMNRGIRTLTGYGGTVEVNNLIGVAVPSNVSTATDFIVEGQADTITVYNSYLPRHPVTAATNIRDGGWTDGGGNITTGAIKFATARRPHMLGFTVDDWDNLQHQVAVAAKLHAYGFKGSWVVNKTDPKTGIISDADWAQYAELVAAGDEIVAHTRHDTYWADLDAFVITGPASSTMTVTIDYANETGSLVLAESGTPVHTLSLSYSTENSAAEGFESIAELVTHINAQTGYTANYSGLGVAGTLYEGTDMPYSLAAVTDVDITSATTVLFDLDNRFDEEWRKCRDDLNDRLGINVVSFVCPGHNYNAAYAYKFEGAFLQGGQDGTNASLNGDELEDIVITDIRRWDMESMIEPTDTAADRAASAYAFCQRIMWEGCATIAYLHGSANRWDDLLAAVAALGVTTGTQAEIGALARQGTQSSAGGETHYSTDFAASDAVWLPTLATDSPLIDAGRKWWASVAPPAGLDREPFPSWDISVGAVQSRAVPSHPTQI